MLDLLGLLGWLADLFLSWRFYVGIFLTAVVCLTAVSSVSNPTTQTTICVPLALIGMFLSIRWEIRADRSEA